MKGSKFLMGIYILLATALIILGLSFESINSVLEPKQKKLSNYFFIVPSFVIIFFVSAFRGDFMTDYVNYRNLFDNLSSLRFKELFQHEYNIEFGYVLLNGFIQFFTDDSLYLFIVTTLIILIGFYYHISKYSVNLWLSILMFVTIGSYYASFNIVRQILASAIIFAGSKFLYERKFFKFLFVVILASLFHQSSLIMIPFYFILNFRINFRNLLLMLIGSILTVTYFNEILSFAQRFVYSNYTDEAYGMTGQTVANIVLPVALLVFSLFHVNKLDSKNNSMHRVWFNAIIFYAVFNILGLQVLMMERLGRFFSPYALLLIPFIFSKMQNKHLRFIYIMVLIFMLILYNFVILYDSTFDPYYFIWD